MKELDVLRELLAQIGALDLDDDAAAVAELGGVDLTEAGAAERLLGEAREELADTGVELLLDGRFDHLERHRGNVILEMLELVDVRFGQQIGSGREYLTELDVGGAELDQPLAKRFRLVSRALIDGSVVVERRALEAQQALAIGEIAQAVVGEEPDRGDEARKMLRRQNHELRKGRKHALPKWLHST